MTDTPPHVLAGAAKKHSGPSNIVIRICRSCARTALWVPGFIWILVLYTLLETSVADVRAPFVTFAVFTFSWVEMLYFIATIAMILELHKVKYPGDDNTNQAIAMTIVAIAYIIIYTVAITLHAIIVLLAVALPGALVKYAEIFATSEFLYLIVASLIQAKMAFVINSATLKRTIGTGYDFD